MSSVPMKHGADADIPASRLVNGEIGNRAECGVDELVDADLLRLRTGRCHQQSEGLK